MQLLAVPAVPMVPIQGHEALFPVRRIYCVGRNYADHAREMNSDPDREPPFFFTKFPDTVVPLGGEVSYPPGTENYQFEGELVVAIGKAGRDFTPDEALECVFGYAAGLDMTRRDLQLRARKYGCPWDMGKNFSSSAPIGPIRPVGESGHLTRGRLSLTVNGVERQAADISQMIWSSAEIIAHLSRLDALVPGDLIFTGTPAGVGAVTIGDQIALEIDGLDTLSVTIQA